MKTRLVWIAAFITSLSFGVDLVGRVGSDVALFLEIRAKSEGWVYKAPTENYSTGYDRKTSKRSQRYIDLRKADISVPDEYDPRGKLGEIRNQGNCGSCWAFSITASHRDAHMLFGLKDPGLLSEQYLVDCASDMYGCGGGMPEAAKWIIQPKGSPSLTDYPYMARNGRCQSKPFAASGLEWHYIGNSGRIPEVSEIQKAVMAYGPVSVTIAADNALSGYRGGIFRGSARSINHMTNIVGWSKSGGYWIMRNSWGTGWGEQGWGKIAFGANSIATDTIVIAVTQKPPVPVIREFTVEGVALSVKVTLKTTAQMKTEDAKKVVTSFVTDLDARSK